MITVTKRPSSRNFSGNPVHYELTSAQAAADPSIYFEIRLMFRYIGAVFFEIHRWPYYPTNGVASISVQDLLHSQMDAQLPTIINSRDMQLADKQTGQFYIEFREISTASPNPSWETTETDFICQVVMGGINYFHWRGNNFWVNYFDVKKPFLTWQQSGRLADINERMFLAWLCTNTANVKIRCKITFTDMTTLTVESNLQSGVNGCTYFVPSGWKQWDLSLIETQESKKVFYWEIYVVDLTDPINPANCSELFKYERSGRWNLNDICLNYRNSLGGVDSVMILGVVDQTLDYQFQQQSRTFKPDYFNQHFITAQTIITDTLEQKTWKGDLGHLGKEEQDRLRDAQLQRDVWMEANGKWWPINIITRNFKLRSTNDMRFTMPIEFTLAYDGGSYYTPASVNLGDGVFTDNVCLATVGSIAIQKDFGPYTGQTAGMCLITLLGVGVDPQGASGSFRYRVDGGVWTVKSFADLAGGISFEMVVGDYHTMDLQTICTGPLYGKKVTQYFSTIDGVDRPPLQLTVTQSAFSQHTTKTKQQFEFNGQLISDVVPDLVDIDFTCYGHTVTITSDGVKTLEQLIQDLVAAINATTDVMWNSAAGAPPAGTANFPPVASHTAGTNILAITLDGSNQFTASVHY
jgi:hypothetical protein